MMEEKMNQATPLRPQGDRIISSSLVEMDLNKFIQQIREEKTWEESDHNSITIFKSENMRMVLIGIHKNAEIKEHKTNANISVQVLEGVINFTAEEQTISLHKGQMIALENKVPHSVHAQEESFFLLTLAM